MATTSPADVEEYCLFCQHCLLKPQDHGVLRRNFYANDVTSARKIEAGVFQHNRPTSDSATFTAEAILQLFGLPRMPRRLRGRQS
jgi:hypothetical protein